MVKLRMGDPSILATPGIRALCIVLSPSRIGSIPVLPILSVALCEPLNSFFHLFPHHFSETSAPQMVTSGHSETAEKNSENHEEDEHCPYISPVDFDEVKSTAFGGGDEVLGHLLIGDFLNVYAGRGLTRARSWLPVIHAGSCWE